MTEIVEEPSYFTLPGEGLEAVGPQPVPTTIDALTAGWLADLLAQRGLAGLRRATPCESMNGTATKARMRLEWDDPAGRPASVIVKGGFSAHRLKMNYIYAHEARFFREVAPLLDVRVPRCLATGEDPGQRQYLCVLEDLDCSGTRFQRVERPIGFDAAKGYLDVLARLHARFWDSAALKPGGQFDGINHWEALPALPRGAYAQGQLEAAVFAQYLDLPRGRALPRIFHDSGRMRAALERANRLGREAPWCMVHGDFHLGNLYHDGEGRPGVLDWQTWSRGHWAHDVTYFLVSALDMLDRRAWIDALMAFYLERLAAQGVRGVPDHAAAMEAFRVHLPYGLFVWLTNPVAFQAEANNAAVAPRFALAAIDHGAYDDL